MTGIRVAIVVFLAASAAFAQPSARPAAAAPAPSAQQIARAIAELGADSYATREAASKRLWRWGTAAESALKRATASDDAEVATRAAEVLERISWGLSPDVPDELIDLIEQFRRGGTPQRINAVQRIGQYRDHAAPVLVRLLDKAESKPVIDQIEAQLLSGVTAQIRRSAAAGEVAATRKLLDTLAPHINAELAPSVAMFYRTHKLAAPEGASKPLAFWVNRLAGRADKALELAYDLRDEATVEGLLIERADWPALAARYPKQRIAGRGGVQLEKRENDTPQHAAMRAAIYHDLAGHDELAKLARERVRAALKVGDGDSGEVLGGLLYFGEDAAWFESRLLAEYGSPDDRNDWASYRDDYETQRLIFKELAGNEETAGRLRNNRAMMEHYYGHVDRARQLLEATAGSDDSPTAMTAALLLALHYDLDAGAKAMERIEQQHAGGDRPYAYISRDATAEWGMWYHVFQSDGVPLSKAARLIDGLVSGHGPQDEYDKWMDAAAERDLSFTPFASTAIRREGLDRAVQRYERRVARWLADDNHDAAARSAELSRFAQWLNAVGRHERAVEEQAKAIELHTNEGVWRLSLARYQLAAGRADDARRTLERIDALVAGDDALRAMAERLWRRIDPAEADRLLALHELAVPPGDFFTRSWVEQAMIERAIRAGKPDEAAWRVKRLRAWLTGPAMLSITSGAVARARLGQAETRVALATGDAERATALAVRAIAIAGRDVQVAIDLVAAFDAAHATEAGDAVFDAAWRQYLPVARRHPDSNTINNQVAWMAARCRRNIGPAIGLAERGTAAEPTNAAAIDTLAELYFQAGRTDDALRAMRRCLFLEPGNGYFYRQIDRFQAGDPLVDPTEDD